MGTGRQSLRLMETWRSVFYTPIYVAVGGGFLEAEGLDVSFDTCPPSFPHALAALNQGGAEVVQSGIMRSIIASDWGAETVPAHFAKINARDGFFLLSRRPHDKFSWETLPGATVIPVGFSPTPWASFQFALRRHGVDPAQLKLIPGLSLEQPTATFLGGEGDFIHLGQPAAEEMLAAGQAHLAVALGPLNGHIAYSSFCATNRWLDTEPELAHRFVRGYARALKWLSGNDSATVGMAVADFFPHVDQELILRAVARYKEQDTWPTEPSLEPPEYHSLQDILIDAGLVNQRQPYEKIVRPEFTKEVMA